MIKKIFVTLLFSALFTQVFAQFEVNKSYAGPVVGLSFLGSSFQFGGNYEYAIQVENFGNVGVGGLFRYWAYSENFGFGKWEYSDFLIGAQGNYHFNMPDKRFDPWGGIVLAYDAGSVEYSGPNGMIYDEPSYGGVWFGVQGGLRYWIKPNIALSGRIAFGTLGYGSLDFGADFKF